MKRVAHNCLWRKEAEQRQQRLDESEREVVALRVQVAELTRLLAAREERVAALERMVVERDQRIEQIQGHLSSASRQLFGQKSERQKRRPRTEPVERELRRKRDPEERRTAAARTRAARRAARAKLPAQPVHHEVPEEQRQCPNCGEQSELREVGEGRVTFTYEFVPAHFERQRHVQQTLACPKCDYIVTAPAPERPFEKSLYGPRLVAHVATKKCADATPLHRLAVSLARQGLHVGRSTLCDLFHAAADRLRPLRDRMLALIATAYLVFADETTMPVQAPERTRRGYLWTFIGKAGEGEEQGALVTYRFAPSRSGETPRAVLGDTTGYLMVDAYTGYNAVCTPKCRKRGACWSHCRRKFFDALPSAPQAKEAIEFIGELYGVEYEAVARGIAGTLAHRALRRARSTAILRRFRAWLRQQKPLHTPKSPMGVAIRYACNQWRALLRFLRDPRLPLDNNLSERMLRAAASGRKNFLFVGHDLAGDNLAVLYSLVASCTANDVNPEDYLADVLVRVQHHPNTRIDELLPHRWKKLFAPALAP